VRLLQWQACSSSKPLLALSKLQKLDLGAASRGAPDIDNLHKLSGLERLQAVRLSYKLADMMKETRGVVDVWRCLPVRCLQLQAVSTGVCTQRHFDGGIEVVVPAAAVAAAGFLTRLASLELDGWDTVRKMKARLDITPRELAGTLLGLQELQELKIGNFGTMRGASNARGEANPVSGLAAFVLAVNCLPRLKSVDVKLPMHWMLEQLTAEAAAEVVERVGQTKHTFAIGQDELSIKSRSRYCRYHLFNADG
jgi:hypothetical protein